MCLFSARASMFNRYSESVLLLVPACAVCIEEMTLCMYVVGHCQCLI